MCDMPDVAGSKFFSDEGLLLEAFAEPISGEDQDPPLIPCASETARVDMATFGRSRAEVRHIMVHRLA
eukprot:13103047-Alexandrium_andersonii.AAC.1